MGGGHVSRPDFGMPQPDPAYPLTEFYLLLQHALDKAGRFALPALYARVQARQRAAPRPCAPIPSSAPWAAMPGRSSAPTASAPDSPPSAAESWSRCTPA